MVSNKILRRALMSTLVPAIAIASAMPAWADATPQCNDGAPGADSTECGTNALVDDFIRSTAVGVNAHAGSDNSIAVGFVTDVYDDRSIGIGNGAVVDGTNGGAIAIGSGATAETSAGSFVPPILAAGDWGSTVIGYRAVGIGSNNVALGAGATVGDAGTKSQDYNGSTAIGSRASVTADNAMALGSNASASADNSVAIGTGSVADQANTVSMGSAGNERRITNVAAGTAATDAVNVGQLDAVADDLAGLQVQTDANTSAISALQSDIGDSSDAIADLKTDVAANTSDIAGLQTEVSANSTAITANTAAIAENKTAIASVQTQTSQNSAAIATVQTQTNANTSAIATNTSAISTLQTGLASTQDDVAELQTGLAATNAALGALDDRVDMLADEFDRRLDRAENRSDVGTATAVALSGAMYLPGKTFNLTGNVGTYRGAVAGALQVGALVSDSVAVNAGVAHGFNRGGKMAARVGFTVGW
jgi:predicted  nucleic acid-binding Zn-ribbon protein